MDQLKFQKLFLAAFLPSLMIIIFFVIMGMKVMSKYWSTPADWHFIAAFIGTALMFSLMVGWVFGFVVSRYPDKFRKLFSGARGNKPLNQK